MIDRAYVYLLPKNKSNHKKNNRFKNNYYLHNFNIKIGPQEIYHYSYIFLNKIKNATNGKDSK